MKSSQPNKANKGYPPDYLVMFPSKKRILKAIDELKKKPYLIDHNCTIRKNIDNPMKGHCTQCQKQWKLVIKRHYYGWALDED